MKNPPIKFVFSIITKNGCNTEKAALEISKFLKGKLAGFDTVVIYCAPDELAPLVENLMDENARHLDLDSIFNKFEVAVNAIKIYSTEFATNTLYE